MKKLILILCCVAAFVEKRAQVVFCPPGAEWHSNFFFYGVIPPVAAYVKIIQNEQINYTGDSIVDSQVVKVLKHRRFLTGYCNSGFSPPTLIKQIGDTVFMRNVFTEHTWQILYNFAAVPGDSWNNMFSNGTSFTTIVDSVGYVAINGFNLKRLYVRCSEGGGPGSWRAPSTITERLGSSRFLFDYYTTTCGSGEYYEGNLCYQDDTFGLEQFTSRPCNYTYDGGVGLKEENLLNSNVSIYPIPASAQLNIELKNEPGTFTLYLNDLTGKQLQKMECSESCAMDLNNLRSGIYLLNVYKHKKFVGTKKIAVIKN